MNETKLMNAQSRGGTLRWRLLLAFLALSLVPLFGSNGLGFLRTRAILEEHATRNLEAVAQLQAAHVQERLDQRLLYLQAIASGNRFLQAAAERGMPGRSSVMAEAAGPEEVAAYLARKLAESARFDALALFAHGGRLLASTDPSHPVGTWAPRPGVGVEVHRADDAAVAPILRFSVPVTDGQGVVVAHLTATVPLDRGGDFLAVPEHIAGSIESFITDGEGRPLFVSHPHGHVEYDEPLGAPVIRLPPGITARYPDREGVEVIGAAAPLPRFGWIFVTEVAVAEVLGDLRSLRALSLALLGIFAPLVLLAAWVMAGGIAAPIRRLVAATRDLGAGDLSVRVPVYGGGEVAELGSAFNDMAEELASNQRRIERLHRQEIERAEQLATVGELASGVAHEIKNPVVGISNGLDLILRRVEGDGALEPIAAEMMRQLKRIEAAVRDLLSYARPPELRISRTSASEVVERALILVAPGAASRGIRIERDLGAEHAVIAADGEMLGQAVVNLLLNAVEFSPEGETIRVVTEADEREVRISVEDHGPGIGSEVMSHLFKPFFTTRHTGTGLGLPITRGIVERHGGSITVESRPGRGSTFTLHLPLGGRGADAEDQA